MYNFQEQFYQVMTRLRASRAASAQEQDARVTEMINGVLFSKPPKKGPVVIDLQEYARSGKAAASVQGINKVKEIHDFINRRY